MVDHLEQLLRQARTDREEDEEETLPVPGDRDPGPPPARPGPGAGEAAELPPRSPAPGGWRANVAAAEDCPGAPRSGPG